MGISRATGHETPDPDQPLSWAQAKVDHAAAQGWRLQESINAWLGSLPEDMYNVFVSDDRMSFEMRLCVDFPRPPHQQWSLLLGDVIHNLRAALDALVWAHVDQAALTNGQATAIGFPLARTPERWQVDRLSKLRTVPDEIADLIRVDQPFQMADPAQCILNLLHALDIQDKHREMIRTWAVPTKVEHDLFVWTWRPLPPGVEPPVSEIHDFELEPGAVVVRATSPVPIRYGVSGKVSLEMHIGFAPDLLIGERVMELIDSMITNVRGIVHHIQGTLDQLDEEWKE